MTEYFLEPIWPKRRLNIITGASGAGKSRWILPQLFALIEGKPIQDKPTQTTKVAYVCCDRTVEDAQATITDLGFDPKLLPTTSFMDNTLEWSMTNVSSMLFAGTELCFIEAIAALVPGGDLTNYHSVLKLGRQINAVTKARNISFWGSTHTPKLKKGESYRHTRDNVIGSSAWPGIAGTIIHINEEEDGSRKVDIMLRDGPNDVQHLEFSPAGQLVPFEISFGRVVMDGWLKGLAPGTNLSTAQIEERGEKAKLSRSTIYRWIKEKVQDGWLLDLKHGWYKVRPVS